MKKFLSVITSLFIATILLFPLHTFAASQFYTGKILNIEEKEETIYINTEIVENNEKKTIIIEYPRDEFNHLSKKYKIYDSIIVSSLQTTSNENQYQIYDKNRKTPLIILIAIFLFTIIIFGGKKGIRALVALILSIYALIYFLIPQLLTGQSPVFISIVISLIISTLSLCISHGINKKTGLSVISIFITFTISLLFALFSVSILSLTGLGSEEANFLAGDITTIQNLKGLLLAGIIIGTLGVLDDVTTSQIETIFHLKHSNTSISFQELYSRALSIGRTHIASLVNTLALAYAGASLPLFILFTANITTPLWVVLNEEYIVEEIVRTIIGTMSLIIAVPISTLLASWYAHTHEISSKDIGDHIH